MAQRQTGPELAVGSASARSQPALVIVPESSGGLLELLLQASGRVTTAIATSSQNIPLRFRRAMGLLLHRFNVHADCTVPHFERQRDVADR
jgi:hypothetical protein